MNGVQYIAMEVGRHIDVRDVGRICKKGTIERDDR